MTVDSRALRFAFMRLEPELPLQMASWMRWLRHPDSRWVRLPAGIALIIGGIFAILPFLEVWMLPLGFGKKGRRPSSRAFGRGSGRPCAR